MQHPSDWTGAAVLDILNHQMVPIWTKVLKSNFLFLLPNLGCTTNQKSIPSPLSADSESSGFYFVFSGDITTSDIQALLQALFFFCKNKIFGLGIILLSAGLSGFPDYQMMD
jgi:hypothetical protein